MYTLKVTQLINSENVVAINQVVDLSTDSCLDSWSGLDFAISDLVYIGPAPGVGQFNFELNLSVTGYAR